jgi:hypothetical protein
VSYLEDLLLATPADGLAEDLARRLQILLPHLEVGRHEPDLGEAEGLVGDDFQAGAVHLTRALHVSRLQLLEQRVVDPQVDVPPPEPAAHRG